MSGTLSLVRFNYGIAYRLGLAPWDAFTRDPDLAALVEGPGRLAPGRALDIGCGRGRNAIYLAAHGWDVTGIDLVAKATAAARRHADRARVSVRWLTGDVTRLDERDVGDGYTLLLDYGCYHSLNEAQRTAYAATVGRIAAPGATLWMWFFASAATSAEGVARGLPGWDVVSAAEVSREEMRRTTAGLPLRLRPMRAALRRGWLPAPWRVRLRRAADVETR